MLQQNPGKNKSGLHRAEPRSLQSGSGNFLSALLVGEESPDYAAVLTLVKEAGRHLNSLAPPDGFPPDGPAPEMALSSEAAKALGAGSLRDFFSLALEGEEARAVKEREGRLPAFFPQGPESVQPALSFIESKCSSLSKAVFELKKNWPKNEPGLEAALRPLENTLEALTENRLGLIRVERDLWPRMKEEAVEWPRDAKRLWEKAHSLKQSVSPLLKASKADRSENKASARMHRGRRSLTSTAMQRKPLVVQGR